MAVEMLLSDEEEVEMASELTEMTRPNAPNGC